MNEAELNALKNANIIANFEGAVKEARHYIMMGVDNFVINAGDFEIRRISPEMKGRTLTPKK